MRGWLPLSSMFQSGLSTDMKLYFDHFVPHQVIIFGLLAWSTDLLPLVTIHPQICLNRSIWSIASWDKRYSVRFLDGENVSYESMG